MHVINSSFSPPIYLRSPHTQTIIPALLRGRKQTPAVTNLLELNDGDFLETRLHKPENWNASQNPLVIISHGLEGSMESSYILGLVKTLFDSGVASLTWNMRGCGTTPNRLKTWYHSGYSSDLRIIVNTTRSLFPNTQLILIGISIGGNITVKYLGEEAAQATQNGIVGAAIVSAPLDLKGSALTLALPSRRLYMQYLLRSLKKRIYQKHAQFAQDISIETLEQIRSFYEFDSLYTAPLHGFATVEEYWHVSSGLHFLPRISVPTLLLTAQDDPFLSPSCIPNQDSIQSPHILLETPEHGGHVGFIDSINLKSTWLDRRILSFISEIYSTSPLM